LNFLDTSVLVAIAQVNHTHHAPSRKLWEQCSASKTAVSTHTLAEVYSTLTAMPPGLRISTRDAVLVIETFLLRLTPVALSPEEYLETLRGTSNRGHSGGMIYDALHLACARKVNAERIYTWNLKHFRAVAPDLAEKIVTP
jgi:predicted nucleic acid-binding protein